MIQVRFHARGGHGVKTASRILGAAAFFDGYRAQDSPIYGAERRGAAVVAFTRISRHEIRDRGVMPQPDLIVVGDDSLIADRSAGVLSGVESASALFVNSPQPQAVATTHGLELPVTGVDLTALTLEHLGRATAMSAGLAAAAAALVGSISQRALVRAVRAELSGLPDTTIEHNVDLATAVFDSLPAMTLRRATPGEKVTQAVAAAPLHHIGWEGSLRSTPSILTPGNSTARATGSWRIERPEIDLEQCTACSLCFVRCPDGAIALDGEGYPVIDYEHCKGCMICLETCPLHAVTSEREVRAW